MRSTKRIDWIGLRQAAAAATFYPRLVDREVANLLTLYSEANRVAQAGVRRKLTSIGPGYCHVSILERYDLSTANTVGLVVSWKSGYDTPAFQECVASISFRMIASTWGAQVV